MRGFPGENGGCGSAAVAVAVRRQNAAVAVVVGRMRRRKLPMPVCAVPPAASPFSAKESSIPFRSYSQTGWSFFNKFGSEGLFLVFLPYKINHETKRVDQKSTSSRRK